MEDNVAPTHVLTREYSSPIPGIGDEYNDDTGESDDGQANSAGFGYPSEVTGAESRAEEGTTRVDEGTGDRRWQEMYR